MRHNYWAHIPQLESPRAATTEPMCSGACAPQLESQSTGTNERVHSGAHVSQERKPAHRNKEPAHCNERSHVPQLRPNTADK